MEPAVEALALLPEGLTIGALVALFFLGLYRGWIATGREMRDVRLDRDTRIAEARADRDKRIEEMRVTTDARLKDKDQQVADWREAYLNTDAALAIERQQKSELLELSRASAHVLRSLPTPSTANQPSQAAEAHP